MGRPRKPTALLELSGAFKKNPARKLERADEPEGRLEIGAPPPDFLNPESPTAVKHLAVWNRFLAEAPDRCITGSDHTLLANACRLQVEIERGSASPAKHSQMQRYLAALGMTGEGRARRGVAAKKKPESEGKAGGKQSPWQQLAEEARPARVH